MFAEGTIPVLPCPFCGEKARCSRDYEPKWIAECEACDIAFYAPTEEAATGLWNRRMMAHKSEADAELLSQLRNLVEAARDAERTDSQIRITAVEVAEDLLARIDGSPSK